MLDPLLLALAVLRAACRSRGGLVLENLLLRQQLAVPTARPPTGTIRSWPMPGGSTTATTVPPDRGRHVAVPQP